MAKRIYVVATDLSLDSRRAGEIAVRLAARTRAALEFFCAVPASVVDEYGINLDRARAAVGALAERCAGDAGRAAGARVAVVRDVPSAILRQVRRSGASLLVVAPHGATGWKKVMLGSVTEKVLRHATGSVLVARGDGRATFKRSLVGVVPGPGGAAPLRHAIALARALGAELTVIHVVPRADWLLPLVAPTDRPFRMNDKRLAAKTRDVERWVASFPSRGVAVGVRALEGSPAEMLVGEARRRHADLVVVGAADDAHVRRALLGSVSYAVAAVSPVSVLVVRELEKEEIQAMTVPCQITLRRVPGRADVQKEVVERVDELERFCRGILHCRVMVEAPNPRRRAGNIYHVQIDLTVRGREIVVNRDPPAHQAHEDLSLAIRDAFHAARRQLEDYVREHRHLVKTHEAPPHGRVARLFADEGYGFLDAPDGHEVYFHRDAVLGAAFDRLRVGDELRYVEEAGDKGPQASTVVPVGRRRHVLARPRAATATSTSSAPDAT